MLSCATNAGGGVYNIPEQLTLMKYCIYPYRHIFVYFLKAVQLPLLKGQHGRTGKNYAAAKSK